MRLLLAISLLLLASVSLAASSNHNCSADWANAVPICTVLANPAKYDGKTIMVKGLYQMIIHGSIIYGTACPKINVSLRGAADWKGDKRALAVIRRLTRKNQFQPVQVVSRGTFRVAREGECFGQGCFSYEIEEHDLLCAAPVKPDSSDPTDAKGSPQPTPTTH